jgi:hemerythrin
MGYQAFAKHQQAHSTLIARARELRQAVAVGGARPGDLVEFLANTVVANHLFKEDRKFFPLFSNQGA